MMRNGFIATLIGLAAVLWAAPTAHAQEPQVDAFMQQVARLWAAGDAAALVALGPSDGRMLLDAGNGTETVNARHASAALRSLFGDRETVEVRPVRVTLAGGSPARAFGEVAWSFRSRAAPAVQTRSVYVGVVHEANGWRVNEMRVMPDG